MTSKPTPEELKRKLAALHSRDVTTLGHEAKASHQRHLERMEDAYQNAFAASESTSPTPDGAVIEPEDTTSKTDAESHR